MKKHFYILFFIVTCLFGNHLYSQDQSMIDSLSRQLKGTNEDTTKVNVLHQLSKAYFGSENKFSKQYALRSYSLATKINFKKGIANSCNDLGNIYSGEGNHDSSELMFNKALQLYEELNDKKRIAATTYNLGSLYADNGNYQKALLLFLKALKYDEASLDSLGVAYDNNIIGSTYFRLENYSQAMLYFERALKISIILDDKIQMAINYNNIGLIYSSTHQVDKAIEYSLKALKLHEEYGSKLDKALAYNTMGTLYGSNKKFNEALYYFNKQKEILEELNDTYSLSIAILNLGNVYVDLNKYSEAEKYYEETTELAKANNYLIVLQQIYENRASLYARMNNYQRAYEFHQLYTETKDSILNKESNKQIAEMQTKYETEKKDKELVKKDAEITIQQADAKQKALQRNAFIAGFILVLLLAFFVFRSYRQKQKANVEISHQKEIIEEKSKEITDSIHYAKRIQHALLASNSFLKKQLNEYFILYKPKDIVSGDFYWANIINNKFVMVAADCTGHGVPGAFMSLLNISYLNEAIIDKKIESPEKILDFVRTQIIQSLNPEGSEVEGKDGMDAVLCVFDLKGMWLRFACANNPLWLIRNNELKEFAADKMPVGMHHGELKPFTSQTLGLRKGDIIYLLTDGYSDQFGGDKGKKFKYKQLKDLLTAHCNKSMEEQRAILDHAIEQWRGKLEQVDDILIIGIRV